MGKNRSNPASAPWYRRGLQSTEGVVVCIL